MTEPILRVIGTSTTLTPEICRRARTDLGFSISFEALDGVDCLRRGVMAPESYDIYDQWFHSVDLLWTAGSIRPIDTALIRRWSQVVPAGSVEVAWRGSGSRPGNVLYVQPDGTLAGAASESCPPQISMLPTVYNADSFAYTSEVARHYGENRQESWAWLLDSAWHGRCLLSADPAGSAVELAIAARAAGVLSAADPGNLSIEEIDELFAFLMSHRRTGHFGRCWNTMEESVRGMSSSTAAIGSLWSPGYYLLRAEGKDLIYANPVEGARGWHSGNCISSTVEGEVLEMAYAYLNWWLDGEPGAIMARRGYYTSVAGPLRDTLSSAEWAYWYAGEPAEEDLPGPDGRIVAQQGEQRAGGSYRDRMERIAFWSTIMPENNYLIRRWREFIIS
ncbi:extracellular solute-binding protein [Paracoccus liaowanqingii]|uniref:Extracellular solute-binding protein n=1 Tax=Paracoccus liaowanqingii TaxID=2560053 RepID=A0A4P7HKW8_9RHOB|nr:extracellular solute-binding protein [Paracoccus liaowanqingii]QBX33897.1 extracellular solute-binding protein [Paracoccus liaowanqingii]